MPSNLLNQFDTDAQAATHHLENEFARLQAGVASSAMVENLQVETYGTTQPLKAVATITIPDPRTIQIQPWDKSTLPTVEKSILESNLGLNPQNDGVCVRLNIPQPTEERRHELAKTAKSIAEEARISVRQARQHTLDQLKKLDLPEDELKGHENTLQKKVDTANAKIDELFRAKEKAILTV